MISQKLIETRADLYEGWAKSSRSKAAPKPREHYVEMAKAHLEEEEASRNRPKPDWLKKIQEGHEPRRKYYNGQRGCFGVYAS